MSLRVEDWKAVLNQPKNAGLKAFGGTGISGALGNLADAEHDLHEHPTEEHCRKAILRIHELRIKIDEVVNKHRKLYTTACEYLQHVKTDAEHRDQALDDQLDEIILRDRAREGKRELRTYVTNTLNNVRRCRNMDELNHLWPQFQKKFEDDAKRLHNLDTEVHKVKGFHKQPTPEKRIGIGEVMKDYVEFLQQVDTDLI